MKGQVNQVRGLGLRFGLATSVDAQRRSCMYNNDWVERGLTESWCNDSEGNINV